MQVNKTAQFDYSHGYPYNDKPNCLPCHSEAYWNNFRQGYDQEWDTYQAQNTDQRTNIYINGNDNYVNTAQTSGQNQDQGQDQNYGQSPSTDR